MPYLTPKDIARELNVSVRSVTRMVERGELRAVRVGALVRVSEEAFADWQAAHTTTPTTPTPITRQAQRPTQAAPAPIGGLPAGYVPEFPHLWGQSEATPAARPAARRSGSAKAKRSAV